MQSYPQHSATLSWFWSHLQSNRSGFKLLYMDNKTVQGHDLMFNYIMFDVSR